MRIDRDKFLFIYQQEQFKTLSETAQAGLLELLACIEADEHMTDPRWIAYLLATVFHEVAGTWKPIEEFDKGKGRKYGTPDPVTGHVYFGRGFCQITWAGNYKTLGKAVGADLYNNPDLALQPDIAYKVISYGMRNGSFTGASLKQKIHDDVCNFIEARRIINGTDCAEKIANYAVKFQHILAECCSIQEEGGAEA
jgi:predicted chitinase